MHPSGFKKKNIELLILWIIPSIAYQISFLYWFSQSRLVYFGYLSIASLTLVTILMAVAVDFCKLWKWDTSILPKILKVQRPLVYTAYLNLIFILAGRLLVVPTTATTLIESAFVVGLIGMMVGFIHDIFGVDVGLYKISGKNFDREKYGTVLVVARYGFYYFGTMGLVAGIIAKTGYYFLYENPSNSFSWLTLAILSGALASLPILVWALSRYTIKKRKKADR